jgi:hypothetical protein
MFPSGFHDISENDLERVFVDPFIVGRHRRKELCGKFREWLKAVKDTGVPLEIWVGGSFVTYKPEPADVDIACIMNVDRVRSLEPTALGYFIRLLKTDAVKLKYGCHVFSVREGNFSDYNYWVDFFGHSRDGAPQGIARIFLGGGS